MTDTDSVELYKFWKISDNGHGSDLPNWPIIFAFNWQQMSAYIFGLFVIVCVPPLVKPTDSPCR